MLAARRATEWMHSTASKCKAIHNHASAMLVTNKNDKLVVTICICTFRRASVLCAIESVARQNLPEGVSVRILVIDNDDAPTAKEAITDLCAKSGIQVDYRHVPGRNISIARNAALDAVNTPWLAFIDDDERASSDWLFNLLSARAGAHAVFGPSEALYGYETPSWISAGDFHSNRVPDDENPIVTGYSSNALIDMEFVRKRGLRFDPALGRTGGEDTLFFYALHRNGGVLRYARDAVVYEHVVPSRINVRWIAARRYRAGQAYAMMFRDFDKVKYWRVAAAAPLKMGVCTCVSAVMALSPNRAMWWLMRGIFHFGVLSLAVGARIYEEYSSTEATLLHADE
jgi:succinoglycan biosynthesis protein ExoM